MDEEIEEYEKYLLNFSVVKKPTMPKFDLLAYTDNEYLFAVFEVMRDFQFVDDENLTNYI